MILSAQNLGKRFHREWIFRNLHLSFESGNAYAITGANGAGKSTLMQILMGVLPSSEGELFFSNNHNIIPSEKIYQHMSIATPYQELPEELTLHELVVFHTRFKKFINQIDTNTFITLTGLEASKNKLIKFFSSGMKQRIKLALAVYSEAEITFLDEPTNNLDQAGIKWYHETLIGKMKDRIIVIASNQAYEYDFTQQIIHINDYKKS